MSEPEDGPGDREGRWSAALPGAGIGTEAGGWPYAVVLLGAFAALLAGVRPVLTPPVLYLLVLYLAWPLRASTLVRRLLVASSVLAAVWVVHVTGLLLAPFILAFIAAYIVDPVVDWLHSRGVPRSLAIGLMALPLLGILVLVALVLVPAVAEQVSQLIANVPGYVAVVEAWVRGLREWVLGLEIVGINERTVPALREIDTQVVVKYLQEWRSQLAVGSREMVLGLGRGIGTGLTIVGYLILTPLLTYYLLRDWPRIRRRLKAIVPGYRRQEVVGFAQQYDSLLSRYLRGQLVLAAVVGTVVGVGFWIVEFPYALLVGIVAGVFNVVPYLGFVVGAATAVLIALFTGPIPAGLLKVAGVFGAQQVVEGVLGPYIVGESVGLHPVWVILALALFSFFFGFVGLLIAVPLAVLIKLGIAEAMDRRSPDET